MQDIGFLTEIVGIKGRRISFGVDHPPVNLLRLARLHPSTREVAILIYLLALFGDLPLVLIECLLPTAHAWCQFINLGFQNKARWAAFSRPWFSASTFVCSSCRLARAAASSASRGEFSPDTLLAA